MNRVCLSIYLIMIASLLLIQNDFFQQNQTQKINSFTKRIEFQAYDHNLLISQACESNNLTSVKSYSFFGSNQEQIDSLMSYCFLKFNPDKHLYWPIKQSMYSLQKIDSWLNEMTRKDNLHNWSNQLKNLFNTIVPGQLQKILTTILCDGSQIYCYKVQKKAQQWLIKHLKHHQNIKLISYRIARQDKPTGITVPQIDEEILKKLSQKQLAIFKRYESYLNSLQIITILSGNLQIQYYQQLKNMIYFLSYQNNHLVYFKPNTSFQIDRNTFQIINSNLSIFRFKNIQEELTWLLINFQTLLLDQQKLRKQVNQQKRNEWESIRLIKQNQKLNHRIHQQQIQWKNASSNISQLRTNLENSRIKKKQIKQALNQKQKQWNNEKIDFQQKLKIKILECQKLKQENQSFIKKLFQSIQILRSRQDNTQTTINQLKSNISKQIQEKHQKITHQLGQRFNFLQNQLKILNKIPIFIQEKLNKTSQNELSAVTQAFLNFTLKINEINQKINQIYLQVNSQRTLNASTYNQNIISINKYNTQNKPLQINSKKQRKDQLENNKSKKEQQKKTKDSQKSRKTNANIGYNAKRENRK